VGAPNSSTNPITRTDPTSAQRPDLPTALRSRAYGNGGDLALRTTQVGLKRVTRRANSPCHWGVSVFRFDRYGTGHLVNETPRARDRIVAIAVATLVVAGWVAALGAPTPSQATTTTSSSSSSSSWIGIAATSDGGGYWATSSKGDVEAFGDAPSDGGIAGVSLNQPVVGMAATPDGDGYWLDAADGGIFTFGNARFWGSTASLHLNKPVVGMAPTHDSGGYWLVASDGGIFAFGDAAFEGSMGSHRLNEPIVGMAPTHDGRGYWLVASDGGIFAFGDAAFEGSLGSNPPTSPIVKMTPTPDNNGYWLVSQNGTVYAFGDAANYGSVSDSSAPATSLAAASSTGYWVLTADGSVHTFGDATNFGSPATGPVATPAAPTASGAAAASTAANSNSASASPGVLLSNTATSSTVHALTPSSGTAGGGDSINITGSGLTGTLAVYFGTNASSDFTVNSSTSITAVAPVGAGTVDVRLVMPDGTTSTNSGDRFTYVPTGQLPITAQDQHLEIGGVPTLFTGFNAYQLATDFGANAGCGSMATQAQIDAFFASLRPNSLVRFWAFQGSFATDIHTHQLDWQPLDEVFYAAAKYHVYLIPTISDQGATCDGGNWQGPGWYSGGFMDVYNSQPSTDGTDLTPLSYWDYMNALVSRYADSPALGMWEPMSEPDPATCPATSAQSNCWTTATCVDEAAASQALQYFFTTVGAQIHSLDPDHLVEAGFIGGGECGTESQDYESVGASPGIDVLSVHDYYGSAPLGGDQWNGLAVRFAQAKALDKPIITGEAGIIAGIGQSGCESLQQRASDMAAKMSAQLAAGDSAFLVWDWLTDPLGPCSLNTGPDDSSLLAAIASQLSG
jgi:IPT/TIG domain